MSEKQDNNDWRELLKKAKDKSNDTKGRLNSFRGGGRFKFSLWYLVIAVLLISMLNMFVFDRSSKNTSYSDFKSLVQSGQIREVHFTKNSMIGYSMSGNQMESTNSLLNMFQSGKNSNVGMTMWKTERIMDDPNLLPLLEENNVVLLGIPERNNYFLDLILRVVIPVVLLLFIWRIVLGRMGGLGGSNVMSFGQNNAKIVAEKDLLTRFKDIAGCDEAKEELVEIVEFLKHPIKYTTIGGKIPKGAILVGEPGTGKTLLARAVAGEAGVTFFRMSGADFVEMFVGVGAARVRDLFRQAREKAPCIIFIDELDAVGKSRSGTLSTNDEREQTLNQLLVEMDGFDSTSGVIILAATNRMEVLDPALLRPGRFDRQVVVDKPDQSGREAILKIHAAGVKLAEGLDLSEVAKATAGLAGADLANIVNEAALLAVRFGHEAVTQEIFFEAIEKTAIGLEKKNKILNPHEREVTAYHETGHALVNIFTPNQDPVKKITIVPRGYGVMGYMLPIPGEEKSFQTREELEGRIDVALAGRAAEEIIYGTISTGAGNDIIQATDICRSMITRFGMSRRFPNVALGGKRQTGFPGIKDPYLGETREYSEDTQKMIDEEISQIMEKSYKQVLAMLKRNQNLLETITQKLLDRETIENLELMDLIQKDSQGSKEYAHRTSRDTKPSERAKTSGDARNQVIKERMARKEEEELEAERLAAEKAANEQAQTDEPENS